MKKVLIISAGFGEGHDTAAMSIRDAVELISDEVRVEVLDLLEASFGPLYHLARRTHLKVAQFAPGLWNGVSSLFEASTGLGRQLGGTGTRRLQERLAAVLHETQPDCVVSTFPLYSRIVDGLFEDHRERPFRYISIITDPQSIQPAWHLSRSDLYCVMNDEARRQLSESGVSDQSIRVTGFPVHPEFAQPGPYETTAPDRNDLRRILYIINCGRKKTGRSLDRLMEDDSIQLTVTVGRDADLKAELHERAREHGSRVKILGWTNDMARLMRNSHLVIGRATSQTVHEAMAARCPMIINQVAAGQEEENARVVTDGRWGSFADGGKAVMETIEQAFASRSRLWRDWKSRVTALSKPDASLRIAETVLSECSQNGLAGARRLFSTSQRPIMSLSHNRRRGNAPMLLCDFHIHTNYSDGKLSAPEVVDFYGQRGFDCICITDHLADPKRLIGRMSELCNFTLGQEQVEEYFTVLERERRRAWRKYGMVVLTGIEFNKDGFTKKSSAHLLGIDLKQPIDPSLNLLEIIGQIRAQSGLSVASHPHIMESEWGKNTLYLWENQETYAPVLDAWEIANRNNIFNRVGLKKLPFLANSDFHKPRHIYSWKTLLMCEKDPEEIKDCIRNNRNVAITLYRDGAREEIVPDPLPLPVTAGSRLQPRFEIPIRLAG